MNLQDIIEQLDARPTGSGRGYRAKCPAHKDSRPSLWFTENEGKIYFECKAGCHYLDIRDAIGLRGKVKFEGKPVVRDPIKEALRLGRVKGAWERAKPFHIDVEDLNPASIYLYNVRELFKPGQQVPDCLRYEPDVKYFNHDGVHVGNFATMAAQLTNANGELVTIHRTYLMPDGQKATFSDPKLPAKKLMPAPYGGATDGGSIKLYQPINGILGIAEGIETAIAVRNMFSIPTWATWSASGLAKMVIPEDVTILFIFADHDPAGIKAADKLMTRLAEERVELKVCLRIPDKQGQDFDNVWREKLRSLA